MAEVSKIGANGIEYDVADETARADIAALTAALDATNDDLESTQADLATTDSNLATTNANLATTNSNLAQTQSDLDTAEAAIAAINKVKKGHVDATTSQAAQLYLQSATYPNLIAVVCRTYTVKAEIHGIATNGYWILYFQDMHGDGVANTAVSYDFYYI